MNTKEKEKFRKNSLEILDRDNQTLRELKSKIFYIDGIEDRLTKIDFEYIVLENENIYLELELRKLQEIINNNFERMKELKIERKMVNEPLNDKLINESKIKKLESKIKMIKEKFDIK